MGNWKRSADLFWTFLKIGCFTFGSGWSVLAQLEQEFVDRRALVTKGDILDLTTVGKSLPGIMITNISMLFGYQVAGWTGGVCAVVGLCLPAIFILTAVTAFYDAIVSNPWCACALRGIGGAVVAIVLNSVLSLGKDALQRHFTFIICAAAFLLRRFAGVSSIILVAAGVAGALLWMGTGRTVPGPPERPGEGERK